MDNVCQAWNGQLSKVFYRLYPKILYFKMLSKYEYKLFPRICYYSISKQIYITLIFLFQNIVFKYLKTSILEHCYE